MGPAAAAAAAAAALKPFRAAVSAAGVIAPCCCRTRCSWLGAVPPADAACSTAVLNECTLADLLLDSPPAQHEPPGSVLLLPGGGEGMTNRCRVDASLAPEVSDSSLEWPQGLHGS
jgi:hypothetical protein